MLALKKIAVTGTVASGKSSVLKFFKELDAYVVDSDSIVHELLRTDKNLEKQIVQLLGKEVLEDGRLNPQKIAKEVFNNKEKLTKLEKLIHPTVLKKIDDLFCEVQKQQKHSLFIAEIPLLFEIGAEKAFDYSIVVIADETRCRARFQKEDFEKRKSRLLSQEKKREMSDFIIYNNGSIEALKDETKKIYHSLI